jgi:FMN-dependent oxidoreductase (nitrilotriacetate monooxygenase family)
VRELHLNAFLMTVGHHESAWRLPETRPEATWDVDHYRELARIAERGTMDSLFLADSPSLEGDLRHRPVGRLDPLLLLAAVAGATERIGLVATASTTYSHPYDLARRFASLDHISNGRAGWNIVTTASSNAARNFGLDETPAHAERYARAAEFVEVALDLWDSWEDDVIVADKSRGVFADATRVRAIDHHGDFFDVCGPLNLPRSPQGRPLLVQAGASEDGRRFAARYAEAVFTATQTIDESRALYGEIKRLVAHAGRDPASVSILPGLVPVIGGSEQEAREREAQLNRLIVVAYGLRQLSTVLGIELSEEDLDEPLPQLPDVDHIEGMKSRFTLVADLAQREQLTVRQLIERLGGGRGHRTFAGTPEQVADTIELWFTTEAADGFNVMPAVLPAGLDDFVDHVVPELRRRGLFRHEYEGTTLREHYRVPRPAGRLAGRRPARPLTPALPGAACSRSGRAGSGCAGPANSGPGPPHGPSRGRR